MKKGFWIAAAIVAVVGAVLYYFRDKIKQKTAGWFK